MLDAVVVESPRDQPHRVGEHDEHDDLVRAGPPGVGVRRALRFGFLIGNELVLALDLFEGPAVRAGEVVVNDVDRDFDLRARMGSIVEVPIRTRRREHPVE